MSIISTTYKRDIAAKITASFQAVPTRYVVAVVRAVRKRTPTQLDPDDSVEAVIAHVITCLGCKYPAPLYVLTGGTYISRDGEYRHRLLWYETFLEAEFPEPLDTYVTDLINENKLAFHTSLFGGSDLDDEERSRILERLEEDLLARRAFQACWMVDTTNFLKTGLVPNHHHLAYAKLVYRETQQEDKTVLEEILSTDMSLEQMLSFNTHKIIMNKQGHLEVGCKYIPLTVGDLRDMVDPRTPVWREYKITQRLADLAVSGVCSGFPIIRGFFYVQNVHEGFFDNPELQQDYIVQDHLHASVEKIREAQKALRESHADPANRLQSLEEGLEQPLDRADRYLRLSSLALATVMEHVGMTARDMPRIVHQMILEHRAGAFRPYVNTAMFTTTAFLKIFFDWLWGFLCMHSEGFMHADPHLNNITFQRVSKTYQRKDKPVADTYQYYQIIERRDVAGTSRIIATTPPVDFPFTRYTLRTADDVAHAAELSYLFPYYDIAGSIIDMSRALMRDIPAEDAAVAESLLDGQIKWALYLLELFGQREGCLELITQNKPRLVYLMQTEWPDMFRVLSMLDAWTLAYYWGGLLTEKLLLEQGTPLEVHPAIRETIMRVHKVSVDWLRAMLETLVRAETLHVRDALANNPATSGPPFERRWADPGGKKDKNTKDDKPDKTKSAGWYFPLQWLIERAFQPFEWAQFRPEFEKLAASAPLGERPEGDTQWQSSPLRREFEQSHPPGTNALVFDTQKFEAPRYSATDPAHYSPETKAMLALMREWNGPKANKRVDVLDAARTKDLPRESGFVDRAVREAESKKATKKGGASPDEWPLEGF